MRQVSFKHQFVEFIPGKLDDGVLYISMEYGSASHLCACGCGKKVVTPFTPTDWKLIYDGERVSLHPSIGNWNFPCESHYFITNGQVKWAGKWSKERIEAGRARDRQIKGRYFGSEPIDVPKESPIKRSLLERFAEWLKLPPLSTGA
ncbi:DUF6527 family protein [Microvirga puerhi]|uniref:Uncharacterized protein n=1 Tax=Microvirga puerhi TaxID=2876078 RepID=A0ABS7VTD4_9HYPH|nr:DUF6527 family protein [Microvirga puerhi]MBZ6078827.1 hypothetical protein [Microvirga puerhi]